MLLVLLLAIAPVQAEEESCPAARAAALGHSPIEKFHDVLAPVWHESWPEKDYDALIAAAPKFVKAFEAVAELDPKLKLESRQTRFEDNRKLFGELVEIYAEAARVRQNDLVYEIMPDLHDAFERTASSLLPVTYREIEAIGIIGGTILKVHLPENNKEGITGSTETLLRQANNLTDETIPEELQYFKKDISKQIAKMRDQVSKMKECCDKNDMKKYREHTETLMALVNEIVADYL